MGRSVRDEVLHFADVPAFPLETPYGLMKPFNGPPLCICYQLIANSCIAVAEPPIGVRISLRLNRISGTKANVEFIGAERQQGRFSTFLRSAREKRERKKLLLFLFFFLSFQTFVFLL